MNKPDLLICWIKHCDYPLFRKYLRDNRTFFGKIIIYWSEHFRDMYYNKFIQDDLSELGDITFIQNVDYQYGVEDWRNVATNIMLKESTAEWVCSVEQDFFAKDWKKVLDVTAKAMEENDLVGWGAKSGAKQFYIHPAYFFIRRALLEKTRMDFSAKEGEDHFGLITRDVENLARPGKIFCIERDGGLDCSVSAQADCFHQGGINQNYLQGLEPGFEFHRGELFYIYNFWSMRAYQTSQDQGFLNLMVKMDTLLREKYPNIDPQNNDWIEFYK